MSFLPKAIEREHVCELKPPQVFSAQAAIVALEETNEISKSIAGPDVSFSASAINDGVHGPKVRNDPF
jgi:hypothetical protein